jgi:hypothetical protein
MFIIKRKSYNNIPPYTYHNLNLNRCLRIAYQSAGNKTLKCLSKEEKHFQTVEQKTILNPLKGNDCSNTTLDREITHMMRRNFDW